MIDTLPNVIDRRFELQLKLGEGTYGVVYLAFDSKTQASVALKIGPKEHVRQREASLMSILTNYPGFPRLLSTGTYGNNRYIAMQLLGQSVYDRTSHKTSHLGEKDIIKILKSSLKRLQLLHSKGYVHCDLKLQHLIYDLKGRKLYLTDFGLSAPAVTELTENIPISKFPRGNPRFCSVRAHFFKYLGPFDDIESLAYIGAFLLKGFLPWDAAVNLKGDLCENIKTFKSSATRSLGWLQTLPAELQEILSYVRDQPAVSKPNYGYLGDLINHWLLKLDSHCSERRISEAQTDCTSKSGKSAIKSMEDYHQTIVQPFYSTSHPLTTLQRSDTIELLSPQPTAQLFQKVKALKAYLKYTASKQTT
mmetsp:Transcript_12389/g.23468  ORF Transcript_12389/g.23468 Transcript_12389/m.23468 type:complete len:363 (+) Transcript_12389:1174-2262(+)